VEWDSLWGKRGREDHKHTEGGDSFSHREVMKSEEGSHIPRRPSTCMNMKGGKGREGKETPIYHSQHPVMEGKEGGEKASEKGGRCNAT